MELKTYWDYTEKERSEMSEEQVKGFIDSELMINGVLRVIPPKLRTVEEINIAEGDIWFEVLNVVFDDIEKAKKFIELEPKTHNYNYHFESKYRYVEEPYSLSIQSIKLISKEKYGEISGALKKSEKDREFNEKIQKEYEEASEKMEKIINRLYEDWYRCLELKRKYESILDTYDEYLIICEGDSAMAKTFLGKVYIADDILSYEEWFKS